MKAQNPLRKVRERTGNKSGNQIWRRVSRQIYQVQLTDISFTPLLDPGYVTLTMIIF